MYLEVDKHKQTSYSDVFCGVFLVECLKTYISQNAMFLKILDCNEYTS